MTFHFFSDFASFDFWWSYLNLLNGAAIIDLVMIVKSDLEKCEIVVITLVVRQLVIFLLKWQYFNWIFLKRARVRHVHCPVFFFNPSFLINPLAMNQLNILRNFFIKELRKCSQSLWESRVATNWHFRVMSYSLCARLFSSSKGYTY